MDSTQLQQEDLQRQIAEAKARSSVAHLTEPRAEAAYFEPETGRIVIHLQYGAVFSFLAELGQGLSGATLEDLAEVEVTPSGMGLHWEKLDADLSVPALLKGIYGNSFWMEQLKHQERSSLPVQQ